MKKITTTISAEVLKGYQHLIAAFENTIFRNLSRSNQLSYFIMWDLVNALIQSYNAEHFKSQRDGFTLFRSEELGKIFIGKRFGSLSTNPTAHSDYNVLKYTEEFFEIVPTFYSKTGILSLVFKTPQEVVEDLSRSHFNVVYTRSRKYRSATEYILKAGHPDYEEMKELLKNTAVNPSFMFDSFTKEAYATGVIEASPEDVAMLFNIWSKAIRVFFEIEGSLPKFWEKALVRAYKEGINYANHLYIDDEWPRDSIVAKFLLMNLFNDGLITSFCAYDRVFEIKTMDMRFARCITWVKGSPEVKSSETIMVNDIYSLLTKRRFSSLNYVDKRYSAETLSNIYKSDKELDRKEDYPEELFSMTDKDVRLILHKYF
jgi:hypothetical protein